MLRLLGISCRTGALILALGIGPALAIECQSQAGNGSWGWRIVDGRKCWYEGRRVVAKERLHWPRGSKPMPEKIADAATEQPSWLEHSAASAPPAQILFPVVVAGNILETYPIVWPQPWLASESIMQWPRLLDIDRVPFAAWDKRIGQ